MTAHMLAPINVARAREKPGTASNSTPLTHDESDAHAIRNDAWRVAGMRPKISALTPPATMKLTTSDTSSDGTLRFTACRCPISTL